MILIIAKVHPNDKLMLVGLTKKVINNQGINDVNEVVNDDSALQVFKIDINTGLLSEGSTLDCPNYPTMIAFLSL